MSEMLAKAFSLTHGISSDVAGDILYEEIQKIKKRRPNVNIKIEDERLGNEWPLPQYETNGAAAIDLRALNWSKYVKMDRKDIDPGEAVLFDTGIKVAIEPGWCGMIIPRSGKGHREGLVVGNLTGLIDSDYRGNVFVSVWNRTDKILTVSVGDRIAQMIFVPAPQAQINFVNSLGETNRNGGFGSTGDK